MAVLVCCQAAGVGVGTEGAGPGGVVITRRQGARGKKFVAAGPGERVRVASEAVFVVKAAIGAGGQGFEAGVLDWSVLMMTCQERHCHEGREV